MATADAKPLFIDTNILVYANVATAPLHHEALNAINLAHRQGRPLWISRQVLREFIAARTRPQTFAQSSSTELIIERVRYLGNFFQVADDTKSITNQLVRLMADFQVAGKQIHDTNIVATMLVHDIPCLLTHNTADFRRFNTIITIEGISP